MGASPSGVCKVSPASREEGLGMGMGWRCYKSCHSAPSELFMWVRSTLEQHYGWPTVENKEAKAFST